MKMSGTTRSRCRNQKLFLVFGMLSLLWYVYFVANQENKYDLAGTPVKGERYPFEIQLLDWKSEPSNAPWRKVLKDIILKNRHAAFWNTYYKDVCHFIENNVKSSKDLSIVEIGTAYGGNADAIASYFPSATIVAIDPLLAGYDAEDVHSQNLKKWASDLHATDEDLSLWWAHGLLYDQTMKHGNRYHLVHALSVVAGHAFLEKNVEKFDVAFIDGLHTYEGVKDDIILFEQLVKPGGVLIFNDYGNGAFPGVTQAVDEFVVKTGAKLIVGAKGIPPGVTNAGIVLP